jgi:DNA-binding SARP family transcriptional activator
MANWSNHVGALATTLPAKRAGYQAFAREGGIAMEEARALNPGRRLPADVRSILLLVGYLGLFAVGVVNLFEADWSGIVPIVAAIAGAVFVRGRLLSIGIWLGVMVYGLVTLAQLDWGGILPVGVGLVGAVVGAWPDQALIANLRPVPLDDAEEEAEEEAAPPAELTIRTIGRLEIATSDEELTPLLVERKFILFTLLRLLAIWAAGGDPRITRSALADEIYGRINSSSKSQGIRNLIRHLKDLDKPALRNRIQVSGELLTLNLDGCDVDVARLAAVHAECQRAGEILPRRLERKANRLLEDLGWGLFLPGFEELRHRANVKDDSSRESVDAARMRVTNLRADIAMALAKTALAANQAAAAVRLLDAARDDAGHREDVARLLVTALHRDGQDSRANELQDEYGFKEKAR